MATVRRPPAFGSAAFRAGVRWASARAPDFLAPAVELVGTAAQCAAAGIVRNELLERFGAVLDPFTLRAFLGIASAAWWLANRHAQTPAEARWPEEWWAGRGPGSGHAQPSNGAARRVKAGRRVR